MADNVTADAGSGGAVFATDDVSSVHYPISKITIGADGAAGSLLVGGAGVVSAGVQRVTLASDDPAVVDLAAIEVLQTSIDGTLTTIDADTGAMLTALQIMDDWDESDRCKSNIIVGQAGIAAGTGIMGVTVPRVTLATDDPAVVDLAAIEVLQTSIDGKITTCNTGAVVLAAGTATFGKLAANNGVDIGDVDVTSSALPTGASTLAEQQSQTTHLAALAGAVAGTEMQVDIVSGGTGSTQYAEDSIHSTGDTGTMALVVRSDAGGTLAGTDGDYAPLQVDASGNLRVTGGGGGVEYTEDVAAAADPVGTASILIRDDAPGALVSTDGDNVAQRGTNYGAAFCQIVDSSGNFVDSFGGSGGTASADDADFVAGTTQGTQVQGVYESSPTSVTDGDVGQIGITAMRQVRTSAAQEGSWIVDCNGSNVTVDNASIAVTHAALTELAGAIDTEMQCDIVTSALPTGAATDAKLDDIIADTAAIQTAVEIIDNAIATTAAAAGATPVGIPSLAVRNDDLADLAGADADFAPLQVTQNGALLMCPAANDDYKYAVIDDATSGDNTIQAAVASRKIRVVAAFLVSAGTVNARFESGAAGTALTGQMNLVANSGFTLPFNPAGWFETAVNTLLNLELSAAVSVDGCITYIEVP